MFERLAGGRRRGRGALVAVFIAPLETAARVLVVAPLLSAQVHTRVLYALTQRRPELSERLPAECRAHRYDAHESLLCRVCHVVSRQPFATGEPEGLDELCHAVEVADRELLPNVARALKIAGCAVSTEQPQQV